MNRRHFMISSGAAAALNWVGNRSEMVAESFNASANKGEKDSVNEGEFLANLYDRLHDSPMQQKMRRIAPMPFGVVFLAWDGITEEEIRGQFQTMKRLGFDNLKQVMGTPAWPQKRIMEIALEENVIPFWYGEGGWEDITPSLLQRLGIPIELSIKEIRIHPKMVAYQKEIIRKGIALDAGVALLDARHQGQKAFHHTADPFIHPEDVPFFKQWLRSAYHSPSEVAKAWNQHEVGFDDIPFLTWEDVDRGVDETSRQLNVLGEYGREYSRVRDVLRYKADNLTQQIRERVMAQHAALPEAPTRTGGEMGLFLPFAWRATKMEDLAATQTEYGSFYPSIHLSWHFGEVDYEVARPVYMQASFGNDMFKGGWAASWESTGGPQQLTGGKGGTYEDKSATPGFTVNAGTMTQLMLSYLAAGFKGAGFWTWNYREAGFEAGEYALLDRQLRPSARAVRVGAIARAAKLYRDELWTARKEPQVGILVNWDSDAIWAALSVRGRDHFRDYPMQARVGVSRALINGNIPWEYVTVRDLAAGLGARYKTIYLPAQIALTNELLLLLSNYTEHGGVVVLDSPGAMYDEHGKVLNTAKGSPFEKLFGLEIADLQYSGNVPRSLSGRRLHGFISELHPTSGVTQSAFQTGEAAVVEHLLGKGSTIALAWDASYELFKPGHPELEAELIKTAFGKIISPYACDGALVYRLAATNADHYFIINDDESKQVRLDTKHQVYKSATDPVTAAVLPLDLPIALEGYSGRWIRFEKF